MSAVHTKLAPEPSAALAMYMFIPKPASSTPSNLDCHRTAPSIFLMVSRLSRGWVGMSNWCRVGASIVIVVSSAGSKMA
eukprot:scaffold25739_cov118-Isochrysis_galbana.AAC.3